MASLLATKSNQTPNFGAVTTSNKILSQYPTAATPIMPKAAPVAQPVAPAVAQYVPPPPVAAAPITPAALQAPVQPMAIPQYVPPPIPTVQQLVQANAAPSGEVKAAEEAQGATLARIEALIGKQATEGARKGELETEAGIPGLQKNLNEITAQINAINSSAFQQTQNAENRLAPTFSIYGEQAQIARQQSAQTFGLSAAASAMQGNIALAKDNVQRALDAEFGGIESQLKFQQLILDLNRDKLSSAEKKQADAFEIQLKERDRLLAEEKSDREAVYNMMLQAAEVGADTATINKIAQSKSVGEAILNAGPSLGAEFKARMKQQEFENKLRVQQFEYQKFSDSAKAAGNNVTSEIASDLTSILGSGKVGAGTKTAISTILGVIYAAEDLAKARPDGKFTGLNPLAGVVDLLTPESAKRASSVENRGYLDAINLKVQQWASGASLTAEQVKQVERFTPKKTDTDRIVQTKLNNLVNFMNQQIRASLASEGLTYEPTPADLFNQDQSLAEIFGVQQIPWSAASKL